MLNKKQVRGIMWLCAVTYFICYLTRKNFGSIISVLEEEKGLAVSIALTVNAIAYGGGQLISGYMGDKIKPTKLVSCGLITTVLMNLILPLCPNVALMTVVWGINGLAQAFMWPPIVRYLTTLLNNDDYSRACVRVSWGGYIGDIAVYLLSPVCLSLLNWQSVFIISAFLGLILFFVWNIKAPAYARLGTPEEKTDENDAEDNKTAKLKWTKGFIIIIGLTLVAIAIQGILRDGITTWMPKYLKEEYSWGDAKSILSGVILPVFAIIEAQIVSWIYIKFVKNEHIFAGIMFAIACAAALILCFVTGISPAISIALCTVISACMHGINYMLICMVPKHFKKFGKVAFMSGLLNSCTYVGTAIAGYGMALVSENKGWTFTIAMWAVVAGLGFIICLLLAKKWGLFLKEHS